VTIVRGERGSACSTRNTLIRVPMDSSSHMRAPPAPQHIAFSRFSANSSGRSFASRRRTARGASNSPLWRPR
jgi:hypothetical protein